MSRHANQRRLSAAKFRAILSSALAIGLAIGGITGLAAAPAAASEGDYNRVPVYICHAVGNPAEFTNVPRPDAPKKWVPIKQLDGSSMVKVIFGTTTGHAEHQGHWDIIPAFDWTDQSGATQTYPGSAPWLSGDELVNGMTGKQIYANGCSSDKTTIDITKTAIDAKSKKEITTPLELGTTFLYVITVENTGKADANLLTVTDEIPAGLTFDPDNLTVTVQPALDPIPPCSFNERVGTCDVDTLAPNQILTLTLPVTVADGATVGVEIKNTAKACAGNVDECDTDDAVITVVKRAVSIDKTSNVEDGSVAAGQKFNYVLTVTNNGNVPASGVVVKDTLPKDIALNGSPTPPLDWTFTSGPNATDSSRTDIAFTLSAGKTLPVGGSVEFTIPVKASVDLKLTTDQIVNTAEVCAMNTSCNNDSVTLDREWITLGVKSVCTADYVQQVQFTLLTNGVKYTTVDGGATTPVATLTVAAAQAQQIEIGENGKSVEKTENWSSLFTSPVTATIDGVSATGSYPAKDTSCVAPGDLSVEKTQGVVGGTDTQTGDPIDVVPGDVIRYVVTVKNIGGTAIGGTVTDMLPNNLKFQSVSPAAPNAIWSSIGTPLTEVGGTVTAILATPLAPGDSASFTIYAQVVDAPGLGGIENRACVAGNDCDTVIAHVPAIDIIKHVWESEGNQNGSDEFDTQNGAWATVAGGSLLDYTLTVTNTGEGALSGVQVVDNLPPYLKVAGTIDESVWTVVASGGDSEGYGATLTFTLKAGVLAQGESSVITIPVSVHPDIAQDVQTNNAQVCAYSALETELCDEDDVTVDVLVDHQIDILKTAFDSESGEEISTEGTGLLPGSSFYYLLEVANVGDGVLSGTVVTDVIPAGIRVDEIVTDPAGETPYWTCDVEGEDADGFGGTLTCELSEPLEPGSDAPDIRLNVTIMSGQPATDGGDGVSITNTAEVCGFVSPMMDARLLSRSIESTDQVCADDDAIVPVDIPTLPVEDADIDIDKSVTLGQNNPNTSDYVNKDGVPVVNAGSRLLYTLVISNAGLGAATGVEVTDTLPAELRIPEGAVIVAEGWTLVGGTDHSFGESLTFVRDVEDELSDSLGTGATWTILIPVEVNPDAAKVTAGTIVNTAEVCAENDFTSPDGSEEPTGCEADDATVLIETVEVPTLALTGSDGFNGTLAMGLLALTGGIGILAAARRKGQRI